MKVVFRVDAAPSIGGGHLSRCLTLASKLKAEGARCLFVMREHSDYLGQQVQLAGFELLVLPKEASHSINAKSYETWVGAPWDLDATQTSQILAESLVDSVDWIIVDHYGLDYKWESYFKGKGIKVGVIDDLVNRYHSCDFLLDQTYGRESKEYIPLVSNDTKLFVGERYCLLRDEFIVVRDIAIRKRSAFKKIEKILVNFGSTDPTGHTLDALRCLIPFSVSHNIEVSVVVGSSCLYLQEIKELVKKVPYETVLHVDCERISDILVEVDVAIGAAGGSSWERCFLGLPTLVVKTAENQHAAIKQLIATGTAIELKGSVLSIDVLNSSLAIVQSKYETLSSSALNMMIGKSTHEVIIEVMFNRK